MRRLYSIGVMVNGARKAMFGVLAVAAAAAALAACSDRPERRRATADRAPALASASESPSASASAAAAESNILRADYVGPDACAECHAEKHDAWRRSLHA